MSTSDWWFITISTGDSVRIDADALEARAAQAQQVKQPARHDLHVAREVRALARGRSSEAGRSQRYMQSGPRRTTR